MVYMGNPPYRSMDKTTKGQWALILSLCVLAAGILYIADIDHEYNRLVTIQDCYNLYALSDADGQASGADMVEVRRLCIEAYN